MGQMVNPNRRTLYDVAAGADWDDDVVECGSVGWREICVRTFALFDHVTLIARLLTRLTVATRRHNSTQLAQHA